MAVVFPYPVRHGRVLLAPGVAWGFEDPDADRYFIAAFEAKATDAEPLMIYSQADIEVDPETVHSDTGKRVLTDGPVADATGDAANG